MSPQPVPTPDPQHAYLDALNQAIDKATDAVGEAGHSEDAIYACFPDEPYESVVFTGSDIEEMGDEAYETVMMVGSIDLDRKIEEAQATLANLNALLAGEDESDGECSCPERHGIGLRDRDCPTHGE